MLLHLESDSYVAYCLDEAVIFFGLQLENMLDGAGQKETKEERKAKAARQVIMDAVFGNENIKGTGFADPAAMFQ